MTDTGLYAAAGHVVPRQLGDELVLLDLRSGTYFGLDTVGARIWALLDGGNTVEAIGRALAAEFDVAEETARGDAAELLASLVENGLVERRGAPA